jgi:hypothetical protein
MDLCCRYGSVIGGEGKCRTDVKTVVIRRSDKGRIFKNCTDIMQVPYFTQRSDCGISEERAGISACAREWGNGGAALSGPLTDKTSIAAIADILRGL